MGGGIGGLTFAAALNRHGLSCQVLERTHEFQGIGAGVQVAPNASRLLQRLGLADALESHAVRIEALETVRWDGTALLAHVPLRKGEEEAWGAPYYTILRSDLHRLLVDAVPPDQMSLDSRCIAVDVQSDVAAVLLADGSRIDADVVVGADGIRSVIRRLVAEDQPRPSGQTIYRGVVPVDRLESPPSATVRLWAGPGRHIVRYPVAGGRAVSFAATAPSESDSSESWSAPGDLTVLRESYRDWAPEVRDLLGAVESVTHWAVHDREPLRSWTAGRVTLLGDAAHPMLPFMAQGANQAIEDAFVLAGALARYEWSAAFARYEELRLLRTAALVSRSRDATVGYHAPDSVPATRDAHASLGPTRRSHEWLYAYDADSVA